MKKLIMAIAGVCLLSWAVAASASAEEMSNEELTNKVRKLQEKLDNGSGRGGWAEKLTISGLLEAEAAYISKEDENESDVVLSTMEMGADADISKHVSGHVKFLWEEEDTEPVDLDEGYMTLHGRDFLPAYISAGKMYVPFGSYETNMISDPLTLEIGESRESALQLGTAASGFYASVYAFNGDVDETGEDSHADNFGANAGYEMETGQYSLDAGIGYINNILDSDGLSDHLQHEVDDYADGLAAYAVFSSGPFTMIGEYVTALDDAYSGGVKEIDKISAWNAEFGYSLMVAGKDTTLGLSWQGTDDAGGIHPEDRYMGVASMEIFDSTSVALEYFHDEYENNDEEDGITAQLAVAF